MINGNIFLSILLLLFFLIIPIYPNSGSLDFGGHVDASMVYLIVLTTTGVNRSKVLLGILVLIFYLCFSGTYGYIEFCVKILTLYAFIVFVQRFFWQNFQNDILLLATFFILFYSLSFIAYGAIFGIALGEFLNFILLPLIYNFFVCTILLIIIKYNSWPKVKDQVYQF